MVRVYSARCEVASLRYQGWIAHQSDFTDLDINEQSQQGITQWQYCWRNRVTSPYHQNTVVMPKRPSTHVIASKAVTTVASIIAEAGFAVERVTSDYGEDLLVQTAHAGQMDANRLWFQVKGTEHIERFRRADGSILYPFAMDHLRRWIRSSDPVLVVLWDVENSRGYWAWPMAQVPPWRGEMDNRQQMSLTLEGENEFDAAAVRDLAWVARCLDFWERLLVAEALDEQFYRSSSKAGLLPITVTSEFLALVDVVALTDEGLTLKDGVRERIFRWVQGIIDKSPETLEVDDRELPSAALRAAASIVIEECVEATSGFALEDPPGIVQDRLLFACVAVVVRLFLGGASPKNLDWASRMPGDFFEILAKHGGRPGPVAFEEGRVFLDPSCGTEIDVNGFSKSLSEAIGEPAEIVVEPVAKADNPSS